MKFSHKTVVITGAASGIGRAAAVKFASEGAQVIAGDINENGGAQLVADLGVKVRYRRCDVSSDEDIKSLMDFAAEVGGGIDVVFNNAGAPGAHQKIDEISATLWDQTMVFLLRAPAMGIRHAVPHMKNRPGAAIVNTASVAGMRTGLGNTAYSVAKAGVLQLTRVAAVELAQFGIRVNAVCPGLIPTNLFSVVLNASDTEFQRLRPRLLEAASRAQPVARAGSPEDVAAAVAFLASPDAGFITGEHIVVDGGVTLGERRAWDPKVQGPLDFNYIRSQ